MTIPIRSALLALALAGPAGAEQARFAGAVPDVGPGLSGIALSADGARFTAISDRSGLIRGEILRVDGAPVALRRTGQAVLTRADGRRAGDSEGLAIGADGTIHISYEGHPPALRRHGPDGAARADLPIPPGFEDLPGNDGPEALAIGPDGALYMMPETRGRAPLWRLRDGQWQKTMEIDLGAGYAPVGADIGPDGRLYVLGRRFAGLGFASRILRVGLDGREATLVLDTAIGTHGNLEGVSVWRDGQGRLRATMVEDNNELPFLPGGIVEYILP